MEEENEYNQIVASIAQESRSQSAREGYFSVLRTNPDAQAEAIRLSRSTGLPVNAILSNPDEAKRRNAMASVDFDVMAQVAPATARLMGNYEAAKLAHDDLENMGYIETLVNSLRRGGLGLRSNFSTLDAKLFASNIRHENELEENLASGMNPARALRIYKGNGRPTYSFRSPEDEIEEIRASRSERMKVWEEGLASNATSIANLQKRKSEIIIPPVVGKVTEAKGFGEAFSELAKDPFRFIASIGAESMVQSAPGLVAAVPAGLAGGPWGAAATIGSWSALTDYTSTIQDVLGDAGVDISDKNAIQEALKTPAILERVISEAERHAAVVGAVDAVSGGVASKLILPGAVAGKLAGKPLATEFANIGVQTVAQGTLGGLGELGGQIAAGQEIKPGQVVAEFFGEAFGAPAEVFSASSGRIYKNITKVREAEKSSQVVDGINQAASASKLLSRDPQTFEAFVADAVKDGPVETIYIDANALLQSGVAEQVAQVSPAVAQQLEAAGQTGGIIAIPTQEYATYIAPAEFSSVLADHIKVDPDGFSRSEAQSYLETQGETLRNQIEEALVENGNDEAFKGSIEQVRSRIQDELNGAGRFSQDVNNAYSSMVSNYYGVQAAKMGMTPEQLFQQYPLQVRSNLDGAAKYNMVLPEAMPPGMEKGDAARIGQMYDDKDGVQAVLLSQVDQAFAGKAKAAGLNIDNFSRSVDKFALKHIKKHHGNAVKEKARGQVAITSQDVTRIPDIVENYDAVRFDLHDSNGLPVIGYVKKYSDGVIFYSEVHRKKRMDLSAISMRKYPATSDAIKILNNASSYVQADDGHNSIVGDSIGLDKTNIRGSFSPESLTISLLKNADLSTFLHESGHLFLDLQERLATQIQERINEGGEVSIGEQSIANDMQAVLNWLGVKDIAQWNSFDLEQKRPYHEQFARGFESYLFEGKSPSIEMQGIFQRFRSWLLHIYKSLKSLNVSLTDEVRGVFDRMIATNEQIENAQQEREMSQLFETAEQAGMTAQEFVEYQALGVDSTMQAIDELQTKGLRDMQWLHNARGREISKLKQAHKEKRAAVKKQVHDEVMSQPVYQAWNFLKSKEGVKLSNEAMLDMYSSPDDKYALLDWKRLQDQRMVAKEGGLHPDIIAEQFGFSSGDEMVRRLIAAPLPFDMINEMTDARMLELYGEVATPEALERAADEAIHNDLRSRMVKREYDALAKATGQKSILSSAAKKFASDMIDRLRVRDLKSSRYSNAQAKAARDAQKAMRSGDIAQAAIHKRNELIQNYAVKATYTAQENIEKGLKFLRQFRRDQIKGLDIDYKDQIDAILERYDLRPISLKEVDRRTSLNAWLESQREQGYEPDIPQYLLDAANKTSYKNLTVEEFTGLVDTVKQIDRMGRHKDKLLTNKKDKQISEAGEEMAAVTVAESRGRQAKDTREAANDWERKKQKLRSFLTSHMKPTMIMRVFDGGKDNGPFQRYFGDPAMRADNAEVDMNTEATKDLSAIIDKLQSGKFEGKGRFFNSVGRSFNRSQVISIALNMGNDGNKQRLLDGEGWTIEQVVPILQSLSSDDWAGIQEIWDYMDSYRPQIRELHRRVYGVEPKWIEGVPFDIVGVDGKTAHVKGGYYPVVYDRRATQAARDFYDAEHLKRDMSGAFSSSTVAMSFTKARSERVVGRPLRYDLSGAFDGVGDVIHYLAWAEFLLDANKLMRNKDVDSAIRSIYGPEYKKQMDDWLKNIAHGGRTSSKNGGEWVGAIRQNVSAAGLGFNLVTALIQPIGITQSISRIGGRWVGEGLKEFMANPVAAHRFANEKSILMRTRAMTRFREINEVKNRVQDKNQTWTNIRSAAYVPMLTTQKWIDTITWHGAYKKAIAEGIDEETASLRADQAVTDAQGSGTVRGLSSIEQSGGPWVKLFTVFYSFFNTTLNLAATSAMTKTRAQQSADFLLLITIPAVADTVLRGLVSFDADDKEKDLSWWSRKLAASQLSFMMNMFVGMREVSQASEVLFGVNDFPASYSGPSGLRFFSDLYKLQTQAAQVEFDMALLKSAINVLGDVTGAPSAQINRVITGTKALAEGKTSNPLVIGFGFRESK